MNIRLTHSLIELVRDQGRIADFAKWITFKYVYTNSCIYNYSAYKAEKRLKHLYSRNTINRLVKSFLSYGWCEMHKGHLIFKPTNKIEGSKQFVIQVEDITDWKEVRDKINLYLLENKSRQAEFAVRVKSDSNQPANARDFRRAKRNSKKLKGAMNETINPNFQISYDGIKKVLGCGSKSNAFCLIKSLVRKGLLCKKNSFLVHKGFHDSLSLKHLSGVFFISNKKLVQVLPNEYSFAYRLQD